MAWGNWSRKAEPAAQAVVGLDLNAGRARAVYGPGAGATPRFLALDDPYAELPLTISLEWRTPEVGRAGLALVRRMPHAVCADFLPALGQAREWRAGRNRLDAAAALALVATRLHQPLAGQRRARLEQPRLPLRCERSSRRAGG